MADDSFPVPEDGLSLCHYSRLSSDGGLVDHTLFLVFAGCRVSMPLMLAQSGFLVLSVLFFADKVFIW